MNNYRFKFRVWNTRKKQYLNTADLYIDSNGALCTQMLFCEKKEIFRDVDNSYNIIEQCTGLKDCDGKIIYEGDILRSSDGSNYSIEYDLHYARFLRRGKLHNGNIFFSELDSIKAENFLRIVGNIHENPELIDQ